MQHVVFVHHTKDQVAATPAGDGDHLQAGDDALEALWVDVHAVRTHAGVLDAGVLHYCEVSKTPCADVPKHQKVADVVDLAVQRFLNDQCAFDK